MDGQLLALSLVAIGTGTLMGAFPAIGNEVQLTAAASFFRVSLSVVNSPAIARWLLNPADTPGVILWGRFWLAVLLAAALLWLVWRGVRLLRRHIA